LIVANGENVAGGSGVTDETVRELEKSGVDIITSGNHIWDKKDVYSIIDNNPNLIRPINYPPTLYNYKNPGKGISVKNIEGSRVAVISLLGQVFMNHWECPFRTMDRVFK